MNDVELRIEDDEVVSEVCGIIRQLVTAQSLTIASHRGCV